MFRRKPQPAIKSYFFGKGFQDLYRMIVDFWSLNLTSARNYWTQAKENWKEGGWSILHSLPLGFAAIAIFFFGSIWFLILCTIHVLILTLFFFLVYVSYSFLWLIERIFMILRGIFTVCPNCHSRSLLPHYICPNCRVVHTMLVPSSYGIINRTCLCGQKMPTTFFRRRRQLRDYARCPSDQCGRLLGTRESTPICIPLIGGPSVGKTCFLFAATQGVLHQLAPQHGWQIRFLGSFSQDLHQKIKSRFQSGKAPDKTMETNPPAFNLFIHSPKWQVEKLLYFYDAAGEAFGSLETLIGHRFYGFLHGFVFMIDPFSIPALIAQYEEELRLHGARLRPGAMGVEETFDIMVENLAQNHNIKASAPINKPCALLLNKVDAFDLEDRIGERAARRLMLTQPAIESMSQAGHLLCHNFLKNLGLESFLKKLNRKFKEHRFFAVSALGRTPDDSGQPFQPRQVLEPLEWLLSRADRDMAKELEKVERPLFMKKKTAAG